MQVSPNASAATWQHSFTMAAYSTGVHASRHLPLTLAESSLPFHTLVSPLYSYRRSLQHQGRQPGGGITGRAWCEHPAHGSGWGGFPLTRSAAASVDASYTWTLCALETQCPAPTGMRARCPHRRSSRAGRCPPGASQWWACPAHVCRPFDQCMGLVGKEYTKACGSGSAREAAGPEGGSSTPTHQPPHAWGSIDRKDARVACLLQHPHAPPFGSTSSTGPSAACPSPPAGRQGRHARLSIAAAWGVPRAATCRTTTAACPSTIAPHLQAACAQDLSS